MIALVLALQVELRAGTAVVDVTPEKFPVVVNGMFTERNAAKANDLLAVRALVLDDGKTRIAIAVVDSCMVPREVIDAAKESSGLPPDRILVSSTHTHSAPAAMGCLGSDADPDYPAVLRTRIAEAIRKAAASLVPAEAGWGSVQAPEHTYCRRWILRSGKVRKDPFGEATVRANMHPGHQNPDFIGPSGPVDSQLTMLSLRTRHGKPLALLANFSMHYFGSPLLSSDHSGLFCRKFEKLVAPDGGFTAILSQGTSGDLMWMDYGSPQKRISLEEYTEGLVQLALPAWRRIEHRRDAPIAMAEAKLTLRRRVADAKRLEWARGVVEKLGGKKPQSQPEIYAREQVLLAANPTAELKLQALRVGELAITAIPNEVFGITGLKLKAMSPLPLTMNVELANGAEGYIPPPEQHALGGYTTWAARTAGLEEQAEPRIVQTLLGLLEVVSERDARRPEPAHGPYARAILESKPRAYWRFDDWSVPRVADSTDQGHDALYEGALALRLPGPTLAGGDNPCAHFAGGRIRSDLSLPAAFSVEFLFWNAHGAGTLFERGVDRLGLDAESRLSIGGASGKAATPLRTWMHVVLVRDGRSIRVYRDGALDLEADAEPVAADTFTLGAFEGRLDEVSVHPRALSAEEVAAHFRAVRP